MKHSDVRWRRSSHSGEQGNCVEVGAWHQASHSVDERHCVEASDTWRMSGRSTGNDGQCVELRADETTVLARDSKDPDGPALNFGADAWDAFLTTVKTGSLDLH